MNNSTYTPPKVWKWEKGNGGKFANINRPVSGATHEKALPIGKHHLQLYSLGTPNGQKVTMVVNLRILIALYQVQHMKKPCLLGSTLYNFTR
ncbi:hypothetical protein AB6G91_09630 [Providencia vermicola]|uniref:hypothetical protein n=1 Tax=Providencia vermicola TaxID=333965 RepID=UPI0034DD3D8C